MSNRIPPELDRIVSALTRMQRPVVAQYVYETTKTYAEIGKPFGLSAHGVMMRVKRAQARIDTLGLGIDLQAVRRRGKERVIYVKVYQSSGAEGEGYTGMPEGVRPCARCGQNPRARGSDVCEQCGSLNLKKKRPSGQRQPCERCKAKPRIKGRRYCRACEHQVGLEMRESGYLPLPLRSDKNRIG